MNIKSWIEAARPRTLPLSLSSIIVGSALAYQQGVFSNRIFSAAILTTILLQILSNFANDYGDHVKGTDNENRVGPQRATQKGTISAKAMLRAIIVFSLLSLLSGIYLLMVAFPDFGSEFIVFLLLGISAIAAAIFYTVGKKAYGYSGFGDLFVFLFFGLLGVLGTFFLYAKEINLLVFLPAIAIGLLSTAVLNANNMRDIENDRNSNKNTIPVRIGLYKSKKYHIGLIVFALLSLALYNIFAHTATYHWLFALITIPLFKHLNFVRKNEIPKNFDPELKKIALSTFFIAILFFIGILMV